MILCQYTQQRNNINKVSSSGNYLFIFNIAWDNSVSITIVDVMLNNINIEYSNIQSKDINATVDWAQFYQIE